MATKWSAEIYKDAAERHLCTCHHLKVSIQNTTRRKEKDKLLLSFYYLSGYIAECYMKYAILHAMHEERGQFTLKDLSDMGLKTHELKQLNIKLDQEAGSSLIGQFSSWPEVTKSWNEQKRYQSTQCTSNFSTGLDEHFDFIKTKIIDPIKQRF